MEVIATKVGFYGKLRAKGEKFTIKDEKDLGTWMEKVQVKKTK